MVIIVSEASEARQAAVVSLPLPLLLLPFLFPPADLVVQLGLPVEFVPGLPGGRNRERIREMVRCGDDIISSLPSLKPATTVVEDLEGDFQTAAAMPGCDWLFTFMLERSLFLIFSGRTF